MPKQQQGGPVRQRERQRECRRRRRERRRWPEVAVSPEEFLQAGLDMMGLQTNRSGTKCKLCHFKTFFECSPCLCSILWQWLIESGWAKKGSVRAPKLIHLLWTFRFIKAYNTEEVHAAEAGVNKKTFRNWVWFYLRGLAGFCKDVIRWENRFAGDTGNRALVTVDGTNCPVHEHRPWDNDINPRFYTHKTGGAGLQYELAVCIKTGNIVSFNGPFPCGEMNDLGIFKSKLKLQLSRLEMVIADRAYTGNSRTITPKDVNWRTTYTKEERAAMNRARARHETINSRLKKYKILSTTYWGDLCKHFIVFMAILAITQIDIDNGNIPFQVPSYSDSAAYHFH